MKQELNNLLSDELSEAHGMFDNLIKEMKDKDVDYPYDDLIKMEDNSYHISYNAISKLDEIYTRYSYLYEENKEYFSGEKKFYVKYVLLYVVSIIFIRVYHEILAGDKFNEIWHYLVGLFLGSTFVGLINKDINEYRYGTKETRELNSELQTLKEEYNKNYEIASQEINYMFSLNRNLASELNDHKVLVKKN